MKLFKQTYDASGIRDVLDVMDFPSPESNRGYDPIDLIEQFMCGSVLGARRLAHLEYLRADEVLRELFTWDKGMATPSTFSRFFAKFTHENNSIILPQMMHAWWARMPIQRVTVDVDSTVIQRYGHRTEGAAKGYNPTRHGGRSHHPIMAFCEELNMVVNQCMRPGDAADAFSADEFLAETISVLGSRERLGLVRADSGFYGDAFMRLAEGYAAGTDVVTEVPIEYVIKARMTKRLLGHLTEIGDACFHAADGTLDGGSGKSRKKRLGGPSETPAAWEYTECQYRGTGWCAERRIIVVRRRRSAGTHADRGADKQAQGKLFSADERAAAYDYMAFVTNGRGSGPQVHQSYNRRGDAENRIKELKYDFGADGFALASMAATETAFALVMLAYNIMTLFKQHVLKSNKQLATIRFQCIAIGSYLVRSGRKTTLKLCAEGKRRHFLEHIFSNVEDIGKMLAA